MRCIVRLSAPLTRIKKGVIPTQIFLIGSIALDQKESRGILGDCLSKNKKSSDRHDEQLEDEILRGKSAPKATNLPPTKFPLARGIETLGASAAIA